MATRSQILVRGIVQGVGFRPFIFSLAHQRALKGNVCNNADGVLIDIEGEGEEIARFLSELQSNPPPLSQIDTIEHRENLRPVRFADFRIVDSLSTGKKFVPISPDIATCADCLRELFDPADRRYRYPFINCTNCGPRFTIIEDIPYDRARTTMNDFPMCNACREEYENPLDRRFHAEPTACPVCGPQLRLTDVQGYDVGDSNSIINRTSELLLTGEIVAIKGLGGYHLACDALNKEAVERLRSRKYREDKPFALMASSIATVKEFCFVSADEEKLLLSGSRPIVLLERMPLAQLPEAIAPGVRTLGFMLPYTPLHYLLLEAIARPLVMTSANLSDEPICYQDEEANERLHDIADYFLSHNRQIKMRTDDSVARVLAGKAMIVRRSRGYAPAPIRVGFTFKHPVLACGAELKNTFCLARDRYAYLSHHIGDLENLETLTSFTEGIEHFKRLFDIKPEIIAYDLHPEYLSTKYALALRAGENRIGIQHHHAHIASCLADNSVQGEVIGVAMDGLGYGSDGKLWGGEFFVADYVHAERRAHLAYVPMPGGVKATRQPWRMAAVYLRRAFGEDFLNHPLPFTEQLDRHSWATLERMIATDTNCPLTSSMGRLFDAVASLVGLRNSIRYEGQAAIEFEMIADRDVTEGYEFTVGDDGVIAAESVVQTAVNDLLNGRPASQVSASFHVAVAELIVTIARQLRDERHLNRVALSGGVFQNRLLLEHTRRVLRSAGFDVLTHSRVPTNDGGISLGQAAIANARFASL